MKIALDATYSVGDALSGVGVYSRELLQRLPRAHPEAAWDWFYRSQRYWRSLGQAKPPNVTRRFLADSFGDRSAELFHGLNQRLPKRRFRRQIATFHDLFVLSGDYSSPEFRTRFAAQARDAAQASDLIIAVSEFTARQVEEHLSVPSSRIRVVHHGVVPRELPPRELLPSSGEKLREKLVLCVGAIQRRKNQARLVRAFRALPEDWTLILAGSSGFAAEDTLREIAESGCASRIRVTGYLSDAEIAGLYARASIFAFPSLDEGFGMPVLEAMSAGVPVVTSNRSALPEIAGGCALLIDPERDEELSGALILLAKDEKIRKEFAELGKSHASAFTWARAAESTAAVYRELI